MSRLSAALFLSLLCTLLPVEADAATRAPAREGRAEIAGDRIKLDEKVYFEFDSNNLDRRSAPVLLDVARLLSKNPDIKRIEIRGHTDAQGDADYNRELSQRRAEEVRSYLMQHGVSGGRLVARGFGESQLLLTDNSEHAHATNRRVEFVIIRG